MRYGPSSRVTIREAAFDAMEDAYNKASANGKYYANARQIMYAARPEILKRCSAELFNDVYFTQTLLKDYIEEYGPKWNVVWDARGHLIEPHTRKSISLGGAGVVRYMEDWHHDIDIDVPAVRERLDTEGPDNRFGNVLFIEKEGFGEILMHAKIGERWDMAIMSTKGIPVKAACDLIEQMHGKRVRVFVLRDFDYAGFKIVRTLSNGTRLAVGSPVIDLGLRLADIHDLQSEPDSYKTYVDPRKYLEKCGASAEERQMLVSEGRSGFWEGRRVEINAMTSEQLITWLERKFTEHGVKKVVPETSALGDAYRRAVFLKRVQERIEELEQEFKTDDIAVPTDLAMQVSAAIEKDRALAWDQAVWNIAEKEIDE